MSMNDLSEHLPSLNNSYVLFTSHTNSSHSHFSQNLNLCKIHNFQNYLHILIRGVGTKSPLYNTLSSSRRSSSDFVSNRTEMREGVEGRANSKLGSFIKRSNYRKGIT